MQLLGTIAKGAFGKVYRVSLRDQPSAIFAMKVQNKSDIIAQDAVKQMKDEVSIHESVGGCAFVATLYASWQSRSRIFTVLKYATGYGDLYDLWRDVGPLKEDVALVYAAQIALALDFIHSSSVIYRDLKMENIVLDDNGHVQLVDFGLAKWLGLGDRTRTICGTLAYMAPEVATADSLSLGYDHAIVLSHHQPIPSHNAERKLCRTGGVLGSCFTFCSLMLYTDPERRIRSLFQLQNDPAFHRLDFEAVANKQVHPFDLIPRMRHCGSCNLEQGSYMDTEEELAAFGESFNFTVLFHFSLLLFLQLYFVPLQS